MEKLQRIVDRINYLNKNSNNYDSQCKIKEKCEEGYKLIEEFQAAGIEVGDTDCYNCLNQIADKIKLYQNQLIKEKEEQGKRFNISIEKYNQISFEVYHYIGLGYVEDIEALDQNKVSPFPLIEKAINYFTQAYEYSAKLLKKNEKNEVYIENYIANLEIIENIGEKYIKESIYHNLGKISFECNDFEKAIYYFKLEIKKIKKELRKEDYIEANKRLLESLVYHGEYQEFGQVLKELSSTFSTDVYVLNVIKEMKENYNIAELVKDKDTIVEYEKSFHTFSNAYSDTDRGTDYHLKRIKAIEPIVELLYPFDDRLFVDKKIKYWKLLEESYGYLNDRNGLFRIYKDLSCIYDNQKKKKYFTESLEFNERVLKGEAIEDNNYLKAYIMVNLYNSRDNINQLKKKSYSLGQGNKYNTNLYLLEDSEKIIERELELLKQGQENSQATEEELLDLLLIAVSHTATFYQRSTDMEKFREYSKKEDKIKKLLEHSSDKLDPNNSQIVVRCPDDNDYNASFENLSLEDLLYLENNATDNSNDINDNNNNNSNNYSFNNSYDNDNDNNYNNNYDNSNDNNNDIESITNSSSASVNSNYSYYSSIKKNKLEELRNKKISQKLENNEIINENYLKQIKINENNKRYLDSTNVPKDFTPNKKTRSNFHIGSGFEEIDGIVYDRATGKPVFRDNQKKNDPLQLPKPVEACNNSTNNPGRDFIVIEDNDNDIDNSSQIGANKKNFFNRFQRFSKKEDQESKLNESRVIEDDYEEEEYHEPDHYDANGNLKPCFTKNFIVSDDFEETSPIKPPPLFQSPIKTPTKNQNPLSPLSTPKTPLSPIFSNTDNYEIIEVQIFLEIKLYIPIIGAHTKEFDFNWLKERCDERIKLLTSHNMDITISSFTLQSHTINMNSKLIKYIGKKIQSIFNTALKSDISFSDELYLKDDQNYLENGYYSDIENGINDSTINATATKYYLETFRNRKGITSVNINDQIFNNNQSVEHLGLILQTLSNTEYLYLINCRLNSSSIQALSKYTSRLKLKHLDIRFNSLSNLNKYSPPLITSTTISPTQKPTLFFNLNNITSLNISHCQLNNESIQVIKNSLLSVKHLSNLKISGNPDIGDRGFQLLSESPIFSNLVEFEARSCSLSKLPFETLKQLFKSLSNCSNLDIGSNVFKKQFNSHHTNIILDSFKSLIDEGITFDKLVKLNIDDIGIEKDSVDQLITLLENTPKLNTLVIKNNNIGLDGSNKLYKVLPKFNHIKEISLQRCQLSYLGIIMVLYNFTNNIKIIDLSFNNNNNNNSNDFNNLMTSYTYRTIFNNFKSFNQISIEQINLSNNNLDLDNDDNFKLFLEKFYNSNNCLSPSLIKKF
ncbi:hypothetical protein DICPUDRAFT_156939 [Dictyostelium purpureum]|uniref:RNI-like protein n=1 Tax=Dictyostelium purpureum TaxID=5786 RepID=F0ZXU6_DICPU|nr:uncharacterized protein DICPUDRAFT_156939 [Dictyostelium purpureum]EGC31234.1 hypothetical protein DICPUDRAFT_156939 [Dictyostelium purpureum]|eukprot:XP_003292237.1 hypothetical protein DICPUDRAFT_156939 [Dictyostelium purpureum]